MTKTLSRTKLAMISSETHLAAWRAAELFGNQHKFMQGRCNQQGGLYIKHGYYDRQMDFVPISEVTVASHMRNKNPLREVSAQNACSVLRQSFAGHKWWSVGDVVVRTNKFIEPVAQFLADYGQHFDVFADVYENKLTGTNVFGMFIMLKGVEGSDRLAWEITIDDADLRDHPERKKLFR